MRGAGRVGGRAFKIPKGESPTETLNPFDALNLVGDLPVAPVLEPINDEWSISNFNEPVDAKDCAKYPASPYCDNNFIDPFGSPFRIDLPELKTNGCETCVYVYPIIMWMRLQPTIVCHRDPNCDIPKPTLNKDPITKNKPPRFNENVKPDAFKSPACAFRENIINAHYNAQNDEVAQLLGEDPDSANYEYRNVRIEQLGTQRMSAGTGEIVDDNSLKLDLSYSFRIGNSDKYVYLYIGDLHERIYLAKIAERREKGFNTEWAEISTSYYFTNWQPIPCPDRPRKPKIKPPPPPEINNGNNGKKKGAKDMCCNDCADAKDNTNKLLKEIKEIKKALGSGVIKVAKVFDATLQGESGTAEDLTKSLEYFGKLIAGRIGTGRYPIEVPESLLTGVGDKTQNVESQTDYLYWLTHQLDALVGEFPIKIEVKDIDPLKEGDQKKTIELPNIAESIAEIYGLTIKSSVNQEVELNMLLRLAAETIAIKNGVVVAQDYARANAGFLGYKGNYKARELAYNFDFGSVDLSQKGQPIVLEKLLKTVKGFVQGWELEDKETVVGFLQKLMFSAGIIKAVFFRGKNLTKQLNQEATSMAKEAASSEKDWKDFLTQLNNPNSMYNDGYIEKPDIKEEPKDPRKP